MRQRKKIKGGIRISKRTFKGEQSPYQVWKENHNDIDPLNIEDITENETPWSMIKLSDSQLDQIASLNKVYPKLKGRQKDVVDLLRNGQYNQSVIAIELGMSRQAVWNTIQALKRKILWQQSH